MTSSHLQPLALPLPLPLPPLLLGGLLLGLAPPLLLLVQVRVTQQAQAREEDLLSHTHSHCCCHYSGPQHREEEGVRGRCRLPCEQRGGGE